MPINSIVELGAAITGTGGSGDVTHDLTGLGLQEGDFIFVFCVRDGASVPPSVAPVTAGYTQIHLYEDSSAGDPNIYVGGKFMGPTPDTQFVGDGSGSGITGSIWGYRALRGVDPDILDKAVVVVGPSGAQANPGSVTPLTEKALVIVITGNAQASATFASAAPSGYSSLLAAGANASTWDVGCSSAIKEVPTPTAEDPGLFTWSSADWDSVALTVVLRALGAATKPEAPTLSLTGGGGYVQFNTTDFVPDPNSPSDTQTAARYQLATDSSFSSLVFNDLRTAAAEFLSYRKEGLASGTYYGRALHKGVNFEGDWSNTETVVVSSAPAGTTPTLSLVLKGHDFVEVEVSYYAHPDGVVEPDVADGTQHWWALTEFGARTAASPSDWSVPIEVVEVGYRSGDVETRRYRFNGLAPGTALRFRARQLDGLTVAFTSHSSELSVTTDSAPAQSPTQPTTTLVSCGRNIVLTGSAFGHTSSGTHKATEWAICSGSSCYSVVTTDPARKLSWTWEDVPSGSYTLKHRYQDDLDRWGAYSVGQACLVVVPPQVYYTAPKTGQVVASSTLISWDLFNPDLIAYKFNVERSFEGGAWTRLSTGQTTKNITFNPTGLANGGWLYRVQAVHPTTDDAGDWSFILLQLDRTGSLALHAHFADYEGETLPASWTRWGSTAINWAFKDQYDPLLDATFRLGVMATLPQTGSDVHLGGLFISEWGTPSEFDLSVAFEHIGDECEWYPHRFSNPQVTQGGSLAFAVAGGDQSGVASLMYWPPAWFLGGTAACASDANQAKWSAFTAAYAMRPANENRAYEYARSQSVGRMRQLVDRTGAATIASTTTDFMVSTTDRTGGPYIYADEDLVLGRSRRIYILRQKVRRGVSGGNEGWFVTSQIFGAGSELPATTRFIRQTDASGREVVCGCVGLAYQDMEQSGVGRSAGILFTDVSVRVVSWGECQPVGCISDWDLTLFENDDVTPWYGLYSGDYRTGTVVEADFYGDRRCIRPYLKEPRDFSDTETDFPAGAATIGSIRVGVVDYPLLLGDQDSGIVTAKIKDAIGRRAVLRRWREDIGMVTVFDGFVYDWKLDTNTSTYWFVLRDPRERERGAELFSVNETFALWPIQGPLEAYGSLGEGIGHLMAPAQPESGMSFTVTPIEGFPELFTGFFTLAFTNGAREFDFIRNFVYPQTFRTYNAESGWWEAADLTVRWRLSTGGPWRYLRNMPWFQAGSALGGGGLSVDGGTIFLQLSSLDEDDIPNEVSLYDLQLIARRTTEDTPLFWDRGSLGDLLLDILEGEFTEHVPNLRYSPTEVAAWALVAPPGRLKATKPAEMREWIEKNIFAAAAHAPTFDPNMRMRPTSWALPDASQELVELDEDYIIPVGDFGTALKSVVNRVVYTYRQEYLAPTEGRSYLGGVLRNAVLGDGYIGELDTYRPYTAVLERKVRNVYIRAESAFLGVQTIEYEPETIRVASAVDSGLTTVETVYDHAAPLAASIANDLLDRFMWGAAEYTCQVRSGMAHGPTFDPKTLDLSSGEWVKAKASWLPEFALDRRNLYRYMQIKSLKDPDIKARTLRLIDGGPVHTLPDYDGETELLLSGPTMGNPSESS